MNQVSGVRCQYSSFVVRPSSFVLGRSSFVVRCSLFWLGFVTGYRLLVTGHL